MERRKFIQISAVAGSTLASWGLLPLGGGTSMLKLSMSDEERQMLEEYQRQFMDAPYSGELSSLQVEREIMPKRVLRFRKKEGESFSYVNGHGKTVTLREEKGYVVAAIK